MKLINDMSYREYDAEAYGIGGSKSYIGIVRYEDGRTVFYGIRNRWWREYEKHGFYKKLLEEFKDTEFEEEILAHMLCGT